MILKLQLLVGYILEMMRCPPEPRTDEVFALYFDASLNKQAGPLHG